MMKLCRSAACLQFVLAVSVPLPDSIMTYIHSVCAPFGFFHHRDYCRSSSKVPLAEHQVLLEHLSHLQISVYMWVPTSEFIPAPDTLFFFFCWNPVCLNSQSLFLDCNLVSLYRFWNFSHKGHQRLLSSSVWLIALSVWSFKVHPPSNKWHNFVISVGLFHVWVMVRCLYVRYLL